jgi:acetyl-CoA acetyltransferase
VSEIVPVAVPGKGGAVEIATDENPQKLSADKIPTLKPAFRPNGTITAASSSANADGAAALVLTRRSVADRLGLPVLAVIRGHATHSRRRNGSPRRRSVRSARCSTGWAGGPAMSICSRSMRPSPRW